MGIKRLLFLLKNIKKIPPIPDEIQGQPQQADIPQIEETTNEKESDPK